MSPTINLPQSNGMHMNGNLTNGNGNPYSVPREAQCVFQDGIVNNPLMASGLPSDAAELAAKIKFTGTDEPSLPINWRFAEGVSAMKGLEALMLMALVKKKYGVEVKEAEIDTDHAQLFIMSTLIWNFADDPKDQPSSHSKVDNYFPSWDTHRVQGTLHRGSCTNIYKTKDGRYFHIHGGMNPDYTLDMLGIPHDIDQATLEDAVQPYIDRIAEIDSKELDHLVNEVHRQSGVLCLTPDEYRASPHGRANAHVGLYEVHFHSSPTQEPTWWPSSPLTSASRPLAGLKVLDFTRVIAGPSISRGLAELGASVMRITAPHLCDFSVVHCDLNWGKWNCCLDLREEVHLKKLRTLLEETDVVVTGYRPGVLDKWGMGIEGVLKACENRKRGIIYTRENCYGWYGEWSKRSGWQQISDASCGLSVEFGRAMGIDEAVTPVFPHTDYCAGIAGVCGTLQALMMRAEKGGSYTVDTALNYYGRWMIDSVGSYPEDVWERVWSRYDRPVLRHYQHVFYVMPRYIAMLKRDPNQVMFKDEYFENRESKNRGVKIRTVRPVIKFPHGEVHLGYNVGTRTNGVDEPRWPEDLSVEVVS